MSSPCLTHGRFIRTGRSIDRSRRFVLLSSIHSIDCTLSSHQSMGQSFSAFCARGCRHCGSRYAAPRHFSLLGLACRTPYAFFFCCVVGGVIRLHCRGGHCSPLAFYTSPTHAQIIGLTPHLFDPPPTNQAGRQTRVGSNQRGHRQRLAPLRRFPTSQTRLLLLLLCSVCLHDTPRKAGRQAAQADSRWTP